MFPIIKTIESIKNAKLYQFIILSSIISITIIVTLIISGTWLSASLSHFNHQWINYSIESVSGLLLGVAGWFILPAFTVIIAGLFQDNVINRLNCHYYPDEKKKENTDFLQDLIHDVKFTFYAIFLNILILPLYIIGIGFIISILLNSYLLGREFFEGTASFYIGKKDAVILRNSRKKHAYTGGFVITALTLIPVVNIFMPIIATAWMVHVYQHSK